MGLETPDDKDDREGSKITTIKLTLAVVAGLTSIIELVLVFFR
jgi:hypothetical protein